jgi:prepilin-type N-terminal cleavage/methylation domain-containing protein
MMHAGTRASRRRKPRGYTAVELLMAISVFGIGVAGIISMEKVTAASNQHAKNLAIATHIAESWISMLQTDAAAWNHPSPLVPQTDIVTDTFWLGNNVVKNANATSWFLPAWNGALNFGPAFDALGNPINPIDLSGEVFCSHLRLSWLYPETAGSGNGLIRVEVRVFWLRDGQSNPVANTNPCDPGTAPAVVNGATSTFHFVQKISSVRENMTQ